MAIDALWIDGSSLLETSANALPVDAKWFDGNSVIWTVYVAPAPTGAMKLNLTPKIYRMLYYNQWS